MFYAGSKNLFPGGIPGVDVSTGFSTSEYVDIIDLTALYSSRSMFYYGIGLSRSMMGGGTSSFDLNSIGIAPFLGFQVLRQSATMPVSLTLRAGYQVDMFSGDYLDTNDLEMKGAAFKTSAWIYKSFSFSPQLTVFPSAGFHYLAGSIQTKDKNGNNITDNEDNTSFAIGAGLQYQLSGSKFVYLDPTLTFDENNNSFMISLGFARSLDNRQAMGRTVKQERNPGRNVIYTEKKPALLAIRKVVKQYLLVHSHDKTKFKINDVFPIVRVKRKDYLRIGNAKVVKINGIQIILKYQLTTKNVTLAKGDYIKYQ